MGYSPQGCKDSDTTEATDHARTSQGSPDSGLLTTAETSEFTGKDYLFLR